MNLLKVDKYWSTFLPDVLPKKTYLEDMLEKGTSYNSSPLFQDIYISVRRVESDGQGGYIFGDPEYVNVGLTIPELADLYWTQFSQNYLIDTTVDIGQAAPRLTTRIKSIFNKNLGKYLKLIELCGYEYNPLWNVDGEEIHQYLENQGINDASTVYTPTNLTLTHNTATYDDNAKQEWNEVQSGTSTNATTYTHHNAKNDGNVDYVVKESDTAFGQGLVGGDKMHIEKSIRQGNIGVTKTTELIESQRDILKFSIIDEFFKDINEVILIGLYGNYSYI